jgi:putative hydrolase of the HAD superfamily
VSTPVPVPVAGVLFDVDDTLVDTRGAFVHALAAVAAAYLPAAAAGRVDEMLSTWRADAGGHYRAYTRGELGFVEQRLRRANELHRLFGGPPLDEAAFAAWDEVFDAGFVAGWRPHVDASPLVDLLLGAGLPVGALSNAGVAYQEDKLARTGFGGRVPMLVGVDTLGVGKPDPAVFLEAARRLGTDPARTVYVGDELDIDAAAAAAAGLRGIWLDRPGGRRVPVDDAEVAAAGVPVITTLAELPALLGLS